jgi:hypothetical protein
MKHNNVTMYDTILVKKCDVMIFFYYMMHWWGNWDEIHWLNILKMEKKNIWFINGTFIKIRKCWNNEVHKTWYNWHKKIYYMNNIVIVGHHGLFIYLDTN